MDRPDRFATDQILRPILLDDPEQGWAVLQGAVDIFLVDLPVGARIPVMRLARGKTFRGVLADAAFALMACPTPETILESLGNGQPSGGASEQWLTDLVNAGIDPLPANDTPVVAGQEIAAEDKPLVIRPAPALLWIEQISGVSRFVSEVDFEVGTGACVPLPLNSWIEIQPGGSIAAHTQAPLSMVSKAAGGVRLVERFALLSLQKQRAAQEQERSKRIKARADHDAAALATSLFQLGAQEETIGSDASAHALSADPLLAVMHQLARAVDFTLRSPAGLQSIASPEGKLHALATASGVRARKILLRGNWWQQTANPLLGFLEEDGLPVALLPRGNGFDWFHPQTRIRTRVTNAQAQAFRPSAFVFYRAFPSTALDAWSLLRFALHHSERDATAVFLLGVLGGALGMVTPIVTGVVYDSIIPGSERQQLLAAVLLVLAAVLSASGSILGSRNDSAPHGKPNERRHSSRGLGPFARAPGLFLPKLFFGRSRRAKPWNKSDSSGAYRLADFLCSLGHLLSVQLRSAVLLRLAPCSCSHRPDRAARRRWNHHFRSIRQDPIRIRGNRRRAIELGSATFERALQAPCRRR